MPTAFENLGAFLKSYKLFVEKNDINLAPSVVTALDKLDSNKDAAKRKELVEKAVAALTKWENDEKLAKFKDEIKKFKDSLAAPPPPPGKPGGAPPPPPPMPRKKSNFHAEWMKILADAPVGVAGELLYLDNASNVEDAKIFAGAAQRALEKALAEAEVEFKECDGKERKLRISQHNSALRSLLVKVKEAAK